MGEARFEVVPIGQAESLVELGNDKGSLTVKLRR